MKKIAEILDQPLKWVQPSAMRSGFELRADDLLAATLVFRSSLGSFATGESGDGSWTFKRVGFWSPRATVRVSGSEAEIASFRHNTWRGGGTLEIVDGPRLRATSNMWQSKLEFQDESESPLIRFVSGGVLHLSARVEIESGGRELRALPWLILFGWYVTILMHRDASTAAGGAAAAAG